MPSRSLYCLITALISGILLGKYSELPIWTVLFFMVGALLLFILSIIRSRLNPFLRNSLLNELTIALIFLGIGFFSENVSKPSPTSFPPGRYHISGTVQDFTPTNNGDKLLIDVSGLSFFNDSTNSWGKCHAGNVNVLVTIQDATDVSYGDRIQAIASLDPFDTPGNFIKTDYENYLKSKHIFLTGIVSPGQLTIIEKAYISLKILRDRLEASIEKTNLHTSTKSFLITILLGDKTYLKYEDRLIFSDAGIAHIFAVSGLHVSMVAMFLLFLFSLFFSIFKIRNWKYLLVIPFIWCYILLVGHTPATVRAGIMITIGMTALFLQRKNVSLHSLAWAIIIILSFDADALFDIGFQLSVTAVGSLLAIAMSLNFIEHRLHPRLHSVVSICLVTLTATFATWMISAYYFHRFSLIFLPMNLLVVPLLPFYIGLALLYLIFFSLGIDITVFRSLLDLCYEMLMEGSSILTSVSTTFDDLHPSGVSVILWIAGVASIACLISCEKRKAVWKKITVASLFLTASLFCLIVSPAHVTDGFIIQKKNGGPYIVTYNNGVESIMVLPEAETVGLELDGNKIVAVRSDEVLCQFLESDIILICKGCTILPKWISQKGMVVTHPSLHWRHEKQILEEAEKQGIKTHSLRYDGPLHIFNP